MVHALRGKEHVEWENPFGDRPWIGGSCCFSKGRAGIGDLVKSIPKPGAERAIVDCAADLEKQISAISRPSHLLRLVHPPVDQEVRGALGDRRSDPQTATVPLGIVDQPRGLASEIFIDCMQRVPQLARRHALHALAVFPFEDMHDLADPLDAALGIRRLAIPNPPMQTFDLGDDRRLRLHPVRLVDRQVRSSQLSCVANASRYETRPKSAVSLRPCWPESHADPDNRQ